MGEDIKWIENKRAREEDGKTTVEFFNVKEIGKVRRFHQSFKPYSKTPLVRLGNLAEKLGVKEIFMKDESYRFGLNAFKVLGGSYAMGKLIANQLNVDIDSLDFEELKKEEIKKKLGEITFTTATDGNHGRGVAWAAEQLGQKAVVYMPKGSSEIRLNNIKATGAEAYITEFNYDDAVRLALDNANKHGWKIIQDTAWKGYDDIPLWIMQGYSTIILEIIEQLKEYGEEEITHVFLQAGVGSFAGAVQGFLQEFYKEKRPVTAVVEPKEANCMYRSAVKGSITKVLGDMPTIMAGLACGEPNPMAWDILKDFTDMFISCEDYIAAEGMRILGNPLKGDERIISGESGAVTMGFLYNVLNDESYRDIKERLKLKENSKILLISTEGDTDPENYRKIVWQGEHGNR